MRRKNKRILIFIAVLVILLGVVYAFSSGIISNINIGNLPNTICPTGIIPDKLLVLETKVPFISYDLASGNTGTPVGYVTPSWADGSPINFDVFSKPCHIGSSEGENVNDFYCSFDYSKSITNVSSSGIIGKTTDINYEINLTMEKDNSYCPQGQICTSNHAVYDNPIGSLFYYNTISSKCLKQ